MFRGADCQVRNLQEPSFYNNSLLANWLRNVAENGVFPPNLSVVVKNHVDFNIVCCKYSHPAHRPNNIPINALKGHKRIAQSKRSDTLGINANNIPINAGYK